MNADDANASSPGLTTSWSSVRDFYVHVARAIPDFRGMLPLVDAIIASPWVVGLHPWTSMHTLCLVQYPVHDYPYYGPYLEIHPRIDGTLEFRYYENALTPLAWQRVVAAEDGFDALCRFMDRLRWMPRIQKSPSETPTQAADAAVMASRLTNDLYAAAHACLRAETPEDKLALTFAAAEAFARGELARNADAPPPEPIRMPGRPARPRLVHPRALPRRGFGSDEGRAAFIHSIAHIEFNAIDLAWDAVYRFRGLPPDFYADWVQVARDEARHFAMLRARLRDFGFDYGDFDAHNGLWEMAEKTAHSGLERMALVPRVLEARGLDVTPGMIVKLRQLGDTATVEILEVILREEVAHVAAGSRWFRWYCAGAGLAPEPTFRRLLVEYGRGVLHGPFNLDARSAAGFSDEELRALQAAVDDLAAAAQPHDAAERMAAP